MYNTSQNIPQSNGLWTIQKTATRQNHLLHSLRKNQKEEQSKLKGCNCLWHRVHNC